ncbi:hypothetical protein ENBRE01_1297 [Enteropsectra breve]|nr:hypothetical protein ENBRE01_1297 [Enteropsectra breve]
MRYDHLAEARKYAEMLPPKRSEIYANGNSLYSNYKTLVLNREYSAPSDDYHRVGIIPQINVVWHCRYGKLTFYNYEANSSESVMQINSNITHVEVFVPTPGIFKATIAQCLLIVTETEVMIFAVDQKTIIATDFQIKLYSKVSKVTIANGRIFLGCHNGVTYEFQYIMMDIFDYKYCRLYNPNGIITSLVKAVRKRNAPIKCLASGSSYVVSYGKEINILSIKSNSIQNVKAISTDETYVSIQIIEENPLFFSCLHSSGRRDFYTQDGIFYTKEGTAISKNNPFDYLGPAPAAQMPPAPVMRRSIRNEVYWVQPKYEPYQDFNQPKYLSTPDVLISIQPSEKSSRFVAISFNEDQEKNFSKTKPIENFETNILYDQIREAKIHNSQLFIVTKGKLLIYDILDSKKYLLGCKIQDIALMYKNYGDIEFMIMYFELLMEGASVTKLEGFCKNESVKKHALYLFIYKIIKSVYHKSLYELIKKENEDAYHDVERWNDIKNERKVMEAVLQVKRTSNEIPPANLSTSELDLTIYKLKNLKNRILNTHVIVDKEILKFIEDFIETVYYGKVLFEYKIVFEESVEDILMRESNFKNSTLKALLNSVSLNHNIYPIMKMMKNKCPGYLPADQINYQRGLELLKKEEGNYLSEALELFKEGKFDLELVSKFNAMGYFYGSVTLLRAKALENRDAFTGNRRNGMSKSANTIGFYEGLASVLKDSVRCKAALEEGLKDSNEEFLYPFFEAILKIKEFSKCVCCSNVDLEMNLLKTENPLFLGFLRSSRSDEACNLLWRYLLYRGRKREAVEAILNLCERNDLEFSKKIGLLEVGLAAATVTTGIKKSENEALNELHARISLMLKLGQIQEELMERNKRYKTSQLLNADSLFNDYCADAPDLGLRVLDAVNFEDKKVIRELYHQYMEDKPLGICLEFMKSIRNKDLEMVFTILLGKMEKQHNICALLQESGFKSNDIITCTKNAIQTGGDPVKKGQLVQSLEDFTHERATDCRVYCEQACGMNFNKKV